MQSLDEETNEEENKEKLAGDFSRPFSPPSGTQDKIPKDHPSLDDINSDQEWYDEGREGEAETSDHSDNGIKGYKPEGYDPPTNGPPRTDSMKS